MTRRPTGRPSRNRPLTRQQPTKPQGAGDRPTTASASAGAGADAEARVDGEPGVGGNGQGEDGFAEGEFVTASVVDVERPTATRTTNVHHVTPGETVTVRVQVHADEGRVVLHEGLPDGEIAVAAVEPEPIDVAERDDEVFVAWEAPGEAFLEYAAWVDEDADQRVDMTFEGSLLTADADEEVGGVTNVALVGDVFERIVARGEVTDEDLRQARAKLEAEALTSEQFQRVYRAWLRWGEGDEELAELERPPDD